MKKITLLLSFIFNILWTCEGFAQMADSYFWNTTGIAYSVNDKTELYLGNKDHFSNQINKLDYYLIELIGYRKIGNQFSLGLGLRHTENYKSNHWSPGQTFMLYGIYELHPWNLKIRFANRLITKTYKASDTQFGLDNITTVDFFARSANLWPKPYLKEELFSNLEMRKLQTSRLYGGIHLFNKQHWGIDLYYCYWKSRSAMQWKDYNVLGLSTKVKI